jgi:hypothetical protein
VTERIKCLVPFCRRTVDGDRFAGCEVICGKHWRMASATLRRRHSRLSRRYRRKFGDSAYWTFPAGSAARIEALRLDRLLRKLWDRCKASAIEAAAGIS